MTVVSDRIDTVIGITVVADTARTSPALALARDHGETEIRLPLATNHPKKGHHLGRELHIGTDLAPETDTTGTGRGRGHYLPITDERGIEGTVTDDHLKFLQKTSNILLYMLCLPFSSSISKTKSPLRL